MLLLSPAGKLDTNPYYTLQYATSYLEGLTESQKQNYFYAELFDFWFMFSYSGILFLAYKKYLPEKKLVWLTLFPGVMDVFETFLISYYLQQREFISLHQILPVCSSLKWLSIIIILTYLIKMIFWRRANR